MAESVKFPIKKEILLWALRESQKDEAEILLKFPHFFEWINEENYPTFKQLESLANYLKVPFGYMFLENPPKDNIMEIEFRSINNKISKMSKDLKDTIIEMDYKRNWMSDYRKKIGISKLDIITQFNEYRNKDVINNAFYAKRLLKIEDYWYESVKDLNEAYKLIKNKLENAGILVMENGIVGMNTKRPLDIKEFRAFMLYDDASPLIFINSKDTKAGKIFSLIHEYIHVLFEQEDLFLDINLENNIENERFINSITAEFLLPKEHILALWAENEIALDQIGKLSNTFKVSKLALAIKLAEMSLIDNGLVERIKDASIKEFEKKEENSSGGDFYRAYNTRIGKIFVETVIREAETGEISYPYAFKLLGGVKGKTYDKIKEGLTCYG